MQYIKLIISIAAMAGATHDALLAVASRIASYHLHECIIILLFTTISPGRVSDRLPSVKFPPNLTWLK